MKNNELKPRIGLFGRRNVGKSSLVNYLTGQQTAIVSDTAGTTTDPVRKSMEIGGIGPVVLIDTAGIDDDGGELGALRVEKSMAVLSEVDLVLLLYTEWGEPENRIDHWCKTHGTPILVLRSKVDLGGATAKADFSLSVLDHSQLESLISAIRKALPESSYSKHTMLGNVVESGDTVVLVTPIDSSAPEGRMILPQVQVLRDLMDIHAQAFFCQPEELANTLDSLHSRPKLVITDSQAFHQVATLVPDEVPLTSFSVVLARQKGPFDDYLKGTPFLGSLHDGDHVLLLESCTHNVTCEDIGRVKLPAALLKSTGKKLIFHTLGGSDTILDSHFSIADFSIVIQCGGCILTPRQLQARLKPALDAGIPVSNYGLALAWCNGIFERATRFFKQ